MSDPSGINTPNHLTSGRLLARNAGLNLGGTLLPALVALAAVPLLVRGLGDARFGILMLAWTLVGYFGLFDLGIGRAVTHAAADNISRDDHAGTAALLWTALGLLVPLGFVGSLLLYVVSPWLTVDVLGIPAALQAEVVLTFRILAIAIPFVAVTAVLRGVLEARQMFGVINALRMPHGVLMTLGPVAALPFSRSLIPAAVILLAGRLLLAVSLSIIVARAVPEFVTRPPDWRPARLRSLLRFGGWMTVSNIVSPLMATLDRFVVAAVLGVAVVAYYAAPFELVTKMWLFTGGILPVFFPAFTTSAASDRPRTSLLFSRLLRLTFGALVVPALVIVLFAPEILRVWLGGEFAVRSAGVLRVLTIAVFVNTIGQAAFTLVQSLGRPDITGKYHLIELPIYAVLLAALLPSFGIMGAAFAWSLRTIGDSIALLLTSARLLPESRPIILRMLGYLTGATALLVACALAPNAGVRVALAVLLVPLAFVAAWWMLTPDERTTALRTLVPRSPSTSP